MSERRRIFFIIFAVFMLSPAFLSAQAQESQYIRRFQSGAQFYNLSRWQEAAIEFRRAQEAAANTDDWSRALYWVILSQMAYSDFGSALMDMEELERRTPNSTYTRDMVYHRAKLYYEQGFFEDALILFNRYNMSTADSDRESIERRAAAFFWMGECLYSIGEFEEAEKFYAWVIGRYPTSPKVEASTYRLDIIKQKKIEAELLALLQWSHEESLRTSEEFLRTIRTYESTLNMYQRRIAELSSADLPRESTSQVNTAAVSVGSTSAGNTSAAPLQTVPAASVGTSSVGNSSAAPSQTVPAATPSQTVPVANQVPAPAPAVNTAPAPSVPENPQDRARQSVNRIQEILQQEQIAGGNW